MATIKIISDVTAGQTLPDLSPMFAAALEKTPILSYLTMGAAVSGSKSEFKWAEEVRTATQSTLSVAYTAASATVNVTSGAPYSVGDQIHIDTHVDSNFVDVVFRVTVVAGAVLTVTVIQGIDTSFATTGTTVHRNTSVLDAGSVTATGAIEPTISSSFLQLIQRTISLGEKAIREAQGGMYQGIDDLFTRALEQQMAGLAWDTYKAFIYGVGIAESAGVPAKTAGFLSSINTSSAQNRVNAGGGAISETFINDAWEKLFNLGCPGGEPKVMVMGTKYARTIAQLRHAKVTYQEDVLSFGGGVQVYNTELSNIGPATIVADPGLQNKVVLLLSPNWCEIVPAAGRQLVRTKEDTINTYNRQWTIDTELGLKTMYPTRFHGVIYNLS